MPFIRQTRDKRGFEHTYVMHVARPANGPPRTRVLYVFRSPSNLAVGRKALDAEVMEALEHTHPDLSFDWNNMTREAVVTRTEPAAPRQARPQRSRPAPGDQRRTGAAPPAAPGPEAPDQIAHIDDGSLLVATVGAGEAARLRRRHHDLLHRIGRRARTPEDRNRLLDRAKALNPDGWEDEGAIRTMAPVMDAESERILTELPSRRRGRRGGRRRMEGEGGRPTPSGIMAQDEDHHDTTTHPDMDPAGRAHDAGGDDGLGAAAETDVSSDD